VKSQLSHAVLTSTKPPIETNSTFFLPFV